MVGHGKVFHMGNDVDSTVLLQLLKVHCMRCEIAHIYCRVASLRGLSDTCHTHAICVLWDSEATHVAFYVQVVDGVQMACTCVAGEHAHSCVCITHGEGCVCGLEGTTCGDLQGAHE